MPKYRGQGTGELVPGRGFTICKILVERRGIPTAIDFDDGSSVITSDASYGRDMGEEWEHVYLEVASETFFISTSQIVRLRDPEGGTHLYQRRAGEE